MDTHQEELYKKHIMPDSLSIRLGGIGKLYTETNYDQPSKAFFLDVVVDCLLDGEHHQKCASFYIRYRMSFCAMDPRCFLWEIGLYQSDADDELRDANRTKADGNLLPMITAAKYDEIVYDLLDSYNPEALVVPGPVDVYKIAAGLKLKVSEVLIQYRNILGQMHFWPGIVVYVAVPGGSPLRYNGHDANELHVRNRADQFAIQAVGNHSTHLKNLKRLSQMSAGEFTFLLLPDPAAQTIILLTDWLIIEAGAA